MLAVFLLPGGATITAISNEVAFYFMWCNQAFSMRKFDGFVVVPGNYLAKREKPELHRYHTLLGVSHTHTTHNGNMTEAPV